MEIAFVMGLRNGQYTVTVATSDRAGIAYDWINHVITFLVEASPCTEGLADLGAEMQCRVTKGTPAGMARAVPT